MILPSVEEFMADKRYEYSYGPFMGGDPRDFLPDEDANTPVEMQRYFELCRRFELDEGVELGATCAFLGDGSALDGTGLGIGIHRRKVGP